MGARKDSIGSTLANFGVSTIIASAAYVLYSNLQGQISFSWTSTGSAISGCVVSNSTGIAVDVALNLTWANPSNAFSLNFTANTMGNTATPLPITDRPVQAANISLTSDDDSAEFVRSILHDTLKKQIADGVCFAPKSF